MNSPACSTKIPKMGGTVRGSRQPRSDAQAVHSRTGITAISALRDGWMTMPPSTLLDTLLLANQFAPVASPLGVPPAELRRTRIRCSTSSSTSNAGQAILAESADEVIR